MWPHVFKFLGLRGAHAFVKVGDGPIEFSADELHRKAAALEARDAVAGLSGLAVDEGECVAG
jgi:1-acyl-sn-glycerol-3-phosphate acyltransferase